MNYYISDLHLFHEASIGFDGRPFRNLEEMHAEIVRKWNSKVTNGDTVYILGDMSMRGKNEDLIALVAILKGKKILIRGNHDDVSDLRYRQLFQEVCDYIMIISKGKLVPLPYFQLEAYEPRHDFTLRAYPQQPGRYVFSEMSGRNERQRMPTYR